MVAGVAVGADEIGSVGGELYVAANWPAVSVTTGTPMRVGGVAPGAAIAAMRHFGPGRILRV